MRRDVRDGRRGGVAPITYQSIFGANLVAIWHCDDAANGLVGGAVDTWSDRVGGRVLTAPAGQRPGYATNAAFSSGKQLVISAAAGSLCVVNAALTALALNGTKPYMLAAVRFITYPPSTAWAMRALNTAGGEEGPSLLCLSGTTLAAGGGTVTRAFNDATVAHTFESGLSAAGAQVLGVDGSYVTAGTAMSISGDRTRLGVGGSSAGANCVDAAHALYLFFTSQPPAPQIAAGTALARAEFGY